MFSYLWHGNVGRVLEEIDDLALDLDTLEALPEAGKKLARAVGEFHTYIRPNAPFIANSGERWRHQDAIASGFVESAVNQMISKRMVKKQQVQWTKRRARLLSDAGQGPHRGLGPDLPGVVSGVPKERRGTGGRVAPPVSY